MKKPEIEKGDAKPSKGKKSDKTYIEEIEALLPEFNICEKCSYKNLPVCPMKGTDLCDNIRGA